MGSRYERAFGTDWTSLSTGEIIRRAYALGVSETLGEEHGDEYDRLQDEVRAAHDRDIVELAYREGRTEALELERGVDGDVGVWENLIDEPGSSGTDGSTPATLPGSLGRAGLLDRPDDDIDAIELPEFLRRG